MTSGDRSAALALLRERAAAVPGQLRALADARPPALAPGGFERVCVTGVGSSSAHARYLAEWLHDLGVPAQVLPAGAFPAEHENGHGGDALVVFSQGLSPNARLALGRPERWRQVLAVTATEPGEADERSRFAAALGAAGVTRVASGGGREAGALVRVAGPVTAYWGAIQVARAFGAEPEADVAEIADRAEAAAHRGAALAAPLARALAEEPVLWIADGRYAEVSDNLRLKWMEGLLCPAPPVSDLVEFAHGPFQQLHQRSASLLLLLSGGAHEAERAERLEQMLVPERHRLVRLEATLPGWLAIFEHEAQANALLLAALEASDVHPTAWPGRGADGPLYDLGHAPPQAPPPARGTLLADATWPELEARLAAGARTALVPLGSTEQHGPHLPFATDTRIAEALARRWAHADPACAALPALPFGAAREHMAFPGTLDLREETLVAVLADLAASLAHHGFEEVFCFSAHGGNLGALRAADERLRAAARPARWIAFTDQARLAVRLDAVARAQGSNPAAAGQHAGELETSILGAIAPGHVRHRSLNPGLTETDLDSHALFYPDLRRHAPDGVVGDPTGARRSRAEAYLSAWVDVLAAALDEARNATSTTGTVKA